MDLIGRDRFSSMGSDSTGNTKLAREPAQIEVPTVLIVPDPNHHLSLTIKDICRIDYFQDSIGKMRSTITYFSHSTYSATHLKALRVILEINKGLEAIGKTRFGTLYWAGYALLRCIPGISELIETGIIDVNSSDKDKSSLAWFKQMRTFQNFTLELQQLCSILEPIARAIKCLEGLEVTVGDIWKFYVAITAVLHDLFTHDDTLSIPQHVRDDVSAIVNKRYDEMIHGPSGDLFLSGFFLDPGIMVNFVEFCRADINFRTRQKFNTFQVIGQPTQHIHTAAHSFSCFSYHRQRSSRFYAELCEGRDILISSSCQRTSSFSRGSCVCTLLVSSCGYDCV
ncbi:hypothetical protein K438DRAFT_1705900 [Mycena galopus ATCC 62051]|nr:hypothetical protein K438DRAFT_1705900 [Mycena galopus ATCC 62051]